MHIARPFFYLAALASLAIAQSSNANPFNIPSSGLSFTAGQQSTINWKPTTDGTVTILLRSGSSNNLDAGVPIASSIANTGSYNWTPDSSITRGSDYTLEIVDDSDPTQVNYSPYFVIDSTNTVASSTGSASASASASASTTGSSSAESSSATAATTSASSASSSASSSAASTTGSASSSAASSASKSTNAASTTLTTSASKTSSASATASTTAPSVNSAAGLKVGGSLLAAGFLAALVV